MKMAETLHLVCDSQQRQWRLSCDLSSLAMLTVPAPRSHMQSEARPHETAGDEVPGCRDAWVRQTVNGVEDGAAKGSCHKGRKTPKDVSTPPL